MLKTDKYPFADKVIKAVMDGNEQELYNITMSGGIEYRFFSYYRDDDTSISVVNEKNPEQMYFKGLFDGMKICFDSMKQLYEEQEEAE